MPHFHEAENSSPDPACSPLPEPLSPTFLQEIDNQSRISEEKLELACISGDLELLKSVFDHIASLSGFDRERHEEHITRQLDSRVAMAAGNGLAKIVECLLEHGAKPINAVRSATRHKDTDAAIRVFEVLFEHDLDIKDCPGVLCQTNRDEALTRYLLSKGADPNGHNQHGRRGQLPFQWCGSLAIVSLLIDYGADLKHSNFLHTTTGIVDDDACIAQMDLLIRRGVDINDRAEVLDDTEPGTPQHEKSLLRMAEAGTALHWAVRGWKLGRRNVDVFLRVQWLLEKGADTEIRDNGGLRPIDYATSKSVRDILEIYSVDEGQTGSNAEV
ncbi:hypothetical protein HYFRA_00002603 [Hymenoscyphus fraxineus]|uniref:Ankyrin n=1 Tax=Hymenoscyphus fraxineus TaxID=746836 RepID=A0A9N9L6J1_9HELO|nr:hypothetical protein HYFRA_00002603 [Hymenoscyphus fraxineus]